MFDFSMYHLAGLVQEKEAAGIRILLRDKHDKLVILCNDGNYYCNACLRNFSSFRILLPRIVQVIQRALLIACNLLSVCTRLNNSGTTHEPFV